MKTSDNDLMKRLEKIAEKKAVRFCYGCYREAPEGVCTECHSDDLMFLLPHVGCEYGHLWIIEHLIGENVQTVNIEEMFESSMDGAYSGTTTVGWLEVDTLTAVKELDPISWQMAVQEYESQLEDDGEIISFDNGGSYYLTSDVENYVEESEEELCLCEAEG